MYARVLLHVIDMENGEGFSGPTVSLELSDGERRASWCIGPERFRSGRARHVVFTADGGPRLILAIVDGDPERRPFGWSRFVEGMQELGRAEFLRVASAVTLLRLYDRPLRTYEAVANYRVGPPAEDR